MSNCFLRQFLATIDYFRIIRKVIFLDKIKHVLNDSSQVVRNTQNDNIAEERCSLQLLD